MNRDCRRAGRGAQRARDDPDLWVGVLTGGPTYFSAGSDLTAGGDYDTERGGEYGIIRRVRRKPLIAAVEGYALGGGMEIVLACDMVVAASNSRFGLPEVGIGVIPTCAGIFRAPQSLPLNLAREMIFTGEPIGAERAHAAGFVNVLTEPGGAVEGASRWPGGSLATHRCRCRRASPRSTPSSPPRSRRVGSPPRSPSRRSSAPRTRPKECGRSSRSDRPSGRHADGRVHTRPRRLRAVRRVRAGEENAAEMGVAWPLAIRRAGSRHARSGSAQRDSLGRCFARLVILHGGGQSVHLGQRSRRARPPVLTIDLLDMRHRRSAPTPVGELSQWPSCWCASRPRPGAGRSPLGAHDRSGVRRRSGPTWYRAPSWSTCRRTSTTPSGVDSRSVTSHSRPAPRSRSGSDTMPAVPF